MSDLALSNSGITVTQEVLAALQCQRDDLELMTKAVYRYRPHKKRELEQHAFAVEYINQVEKRWRTKGRQVLSMNPDLMSEVVVATTTKIPPEIYRALPYSDPLVVFPDAPIIPSWRSESESVRVLGFFIHGRGVVADDDDIDAQGGWLTSYWNGSSRMPGDPKRPDQITEPEWVSRYIVSSHDPEMDRLGLVVVTEILSCDGHTKGCSCGGGHVTYEYNRTSIALNEGPVTLDEMVTEIADRYNWSDMSDTLVGLGVERRKEFMMELYKLVIGSMMYLCSTTLDAEVVPKSRIKRVMGRDRKPINLVNVGWKIGPALSRFRRQSSGGKGVPTGIKQPPHMRKCHIKVVWTGEGRKIPKTVFISPYWVHKELLGEFDVKTVRAVR